MKNADQTRRQLQCGKAETAPAPTFPYRGKVGTMATLLPVDEVVETIDFTKFFDLNPAAASSVCSLRRLHKWRDGRDIKGSKVIPAKTYYRGE